MEADDVHCDLKNEQLKKEEEAEQQPVSANNYRLHTEKLTFRLFTYSSSMTPVLDSEAWTLMIWTMQRCQNQRPVL